VDGAGGPAGPLGFRAAGALDGEVAYLAGVVSKAMLFTGGAASVAGWDTAAVVAPERFARPAAPREHVAWDAFIESAVKFATALAFSIPSPQEFVLSGRLAHVEVVQHAIRQRLAPFAPTHLLQGFARVAKEGAQGAAPRAGGDRRRPCARGRRRGVRGELREPPSRRARPGRAAPALGQRAGGAGPGARSPAARPGRGGGGATGAAAALLAAPGGRGVAREAAPLGRRRRGRPVASRRPAAARLLLATTHRGRHGIDRVRRRRP